MGTAQQILLGYGVTVLAYGLLLGIPGNDVDAAGMKRRLSTASEAARFTSFPIGREKSINYFLLQRERSLDYFPIRS